MKYLKNLDKFDRRELLSYFIGFVAVMIVLFMGCGGGGGRPRSPIASDPPIYFDEQPHLTYKEKVLQNRPTGLDVGSIRLEFPANAFLPDTEIVVQEDPNLRALGQFPADYTPQSSLFNVRVATPLSSLKNLRQTALIDHSGVYLDGVATLALRLTSQIDPAADYLFACRDKSGAWFFMPHQGRTPTGFYINMSSVFQDYILVRRNPHPTTIFLGNGLSMLASPSATLVAPYETKCFESDLDIELTFALNPEVSSAFAQDRVLLQLVAYSEFTASFLYKNKDGTQTTGTAQVLSADNGMVAVSDRKLFSSFASVKTFVREGYEYTSLIARLKLKGEPSKNYPSQIIFKAFYPGELKGTEYCAETSVLLRQAPEPPKPPTIADSIPASGAVLLPPANIKLFFSHKMVESTLREALGLSLDNISVDFDLAFDEDQKLVTLVPAQPLLPDSEYQLTVATMARAIAEEGGLTPMEPIVQTFTTVSSTGVTTEPQANATEVSTGTALVFTFDKPIINPDQVLMSFVRLSQQENPLSTIPEPIEIAVGTASWEISSGSAVLTLDPEEFLDYHTRYRARVVGGKYEVLGTIFGVADHELEFTTDVQPALVGQDPMGGNIFVTSSFSLSFNKAMATESVRLYLRNLATNDVVELSPSASAYAWSEGQTVLRLRPSALLAPNTDYEVILGAEARDIWGNSLKPVDPLAPWQFSTHPQTSVVSHLPVANAVDVATGTVVQLIFAEPLEPEQAATLLAGGVHMRNGQTGELVPISVGCEAGSSTVTLRGRDGKPWGYDQRLQVVVAGLRDSLDYEVATYSFEFTTYKQPYLVSTKPSGEQNLPTDELQMVFSRPMDTQSVRVHLDDQLFTAENANLNWSGGDTVLRIRPAKKLNYGTYYSVYVSAGACDKNNNGLSDKNNLWGFTTGLKTAIVHSSPLSNAEGIATSTSIALTFAELITEAQEAQIRSGELIQVRQMSTAPPTPITGSYQFFSETVVFTPATPLPYHTEVRVEVASLTDSQGYLLDPFAFSFKTIDQPRLSTHSPASQLTLVTEPLVMGFSRAMASASVAISLNSKALINGENATYAWSPNSMAPQVLTVRPHEKLDYNEDYTVEVLPAAGYGAVKDIYGNHLDASVHSFDFRTTGQTLIAAVSPKQNARDVSPETEVRVSFLQPLTEAQRAAVRISLYYHASNMAIPEHPVWGRVWPDDKTLVYKSQYILDLNRPEIRVEVTGLRDELGYLVDSYHGSLATATAADGAVATYAYVFNLAARPEILYHSPERGAERVSVYEPIVLTFTQGMVQSSTQGAVGLTELRPGNPPQQRILGPSEFSMVWNSDEDDKRRILTLRPEKNLALALTSPPLSEPAPELLDPSRVNLLGDPSWLHNATYTVSVGNGARSINDLGLKTSYSWSFCTDPGSEPSIAHFELARDRLQLMASFNVLATGTEVEFVGLEYGTDSTDVASCTTQDADPRGTGDSIVVHKNGRIEVVLKDLKPNVRYELRPFVKTAYGSPNLFVHSARTAVVHPFNLENNDEIDSLRSQLTRANPFVIAGDSDLVTLADAAILPEYLTSTNLGYVQQAETAAPSTSIGGYTSPFAAQYNGAGFAITNARNPLFAYLSAGAQIENVVMTGIELTGDTVGAIAGTMSGGTVQNCQVSGTEILGTARVGGIVGSVGAGIITNNVVSFDKVSASLAGGVVGDATPYLEISGNTSQVKEVDGAIAGCITALGGDLQHNICLVHEHRAVAGQTVADQKYLKGQTSVQPVIELASTTIPVKPDVGPWVDAEMVDIGSSTQLVFTFSKPMDYKETETAFSLKANGDPVAVTFAWSNKTNDSASILTVVPNSPLVADTLFVAAFADAQDIFAQKLNKAFEFRTSTDVTIKAVTVHCKDPSGADDNRNITYRIDTADVPVNASFTLYLNGALPGVDADVEVDARDLNTTADISLNNFDVSYNHTRTEAYLMLKPSESWPYAASHTIKIMTKDANHNSFEYIYRFTTASQPMVVGHSPASASINAGITGAVAVAFSKPMQASTVTGDRLTLTAVGGDGTNLLDATKLVWSEDLMTVMATPTEKLAYGAKYRVALSADITDNDELLNNPLLPYEYEFETEQKTGIVSVLPVPNAVDVQPKDWVQVKFEADGGSTPPVGVVKYENYAGDNVAAGMTWNDTTRELTYELPGFNTDDFPYDFKTVTVEVGNIRDSNEYTSSYAYSFTTASHPMVIDRQPVSAVASVTEPITIVFDKSMDAASNAGITVKETTSGGATTNLDSSSLTYSWNSNKTVLSISPKTATVAAPGTPDSTGNPSNASGTWRYGSTYDVAFDPAAVLDHKGHNLYQKSGSYNWQFTTTHGQEPVFSPLVVSRNRRALVASFSVTVTDGTPITWENASFGVLYSESLVSPLPSALPANHVTAATIDVNGIAKAELTQVQLPNLNSPYYLYPWVKTQYGAKTLFFGDPVKVVVHPWNFEDNAMDLANTTVDGFAANNFFVIEKDEDLMDLTTALPAYWSEACKYLQVRDIDLTSKTWALIGDGSNAFKGSYNGQNYEISNLTVTGNADYAGMFGLVNNAIISNVKLTALEITNNNSKNVGGLVGSAAGSTTITDVSVSAGAAIQSNVENAAVGGVVGSFAGTSIKNAVFNSNVDGAVLVAGATAKAGCVVGSGDVAKVGNSTCSCATGGLAHKHLLDTGYGDGKDSNSYVVGNINIQPVGRIDAPVEDAINQLVKPEIKLIFSKPMNQTAVQDAFRLTLTKRYDAEADDIRYKANFTFAWDTSSRLVTIVPNHNLSYNATYTILVAATTAKDVYGKAITDDITHSFSTLSHLSVASVALADNGDANKNEDPYDLPIEYLKKTSGYKPIILADGSNGAATAGPGLVATFAEPLTLAQKAIIKDNLLLQAEAIAYKPDDGAYPLNLAWAADNKTLTIKTDGNLVYNASCTLIVGGLTAADGFSARSYEWQFKTTARPVVLSVSPASDTVVLPGNNLVIGFSKRMNQGSISAGDQIKLFKGASENVALADENLHWDNEKLTLVASPAVRLEYGGEYRVLLTGSSEDARGNPMEANCEWRFKIHDRAAIEKVSPYENEVAVHRNASFVLSMVKPPFVTGAANDAAHKPKVAFKSLAGTSYEKSATTLDWGANTANGTLAPADPFPNNTLIEVTISDLRDEAGNLLDYGFAAGEFVYTFNTATMPKVLHQAPLKTGTERVAINEPIVIVFDKPMNPATLIYDNIKVTEESYGGNAGRTLVSDDFTYTYTSSEPSKNVLTIRPKANGKFAANGIFPYNSKYTITYTNAAITDATTLGSNPLDGTYGWSFTTVDEAAPIFGDFAITRQRGTLSASFAVSSEAGPPIESHGFEIRAGSGDWVVFTDGTSKAVNGATISVSQHSIDAGKVSYSFAGFTPNAPYEIRPYIGTQYGVGVYQSDAKPFVVHPFNLADNAAGMDKKTNELNAANPFINPFIIETSADLQALADADKASYWTQPCNFTQTNNLTLDAWSSPIGIGGTPFRGSYSGMGIAFDTAINATGHPRFGLFGSISDAAKLSNISLTLKGKFASNSTTGSLGGIAGYAAGTSIIDNCRITLETADGIEAAGGHLGIVAGELANTATVNGCAVFSTLENAPIAVKTSGAFSAGGIVGVAHSSNTIKNSSLEAKLKLVGNKMGCIIGSEIDAVSDGSKFSGNLCLTHDKNNHPINLATYSYMVSNLTYAPKVTEIAPANAATEVVIGEVIVVKFSKPMDTPSTEAAFGLEYGIIPTRLSGSAFAYAWSDDYQTLTATPKEKLFYNTVYKVVIAKNGDLNPAKDRWSGENQQSLAAYTEHSFTTQAAQPPQISPVTYKRTVADNGEITIVASFTARVDGGTQLSTETDKAGLIIKNGATELLDLKGNIAENGGVSFTYTTNSQSIPLNTQLDIYPYVHTTDSNTETKHVSAAADQIVIHPWNGQGTDTEPFLINSLIHLQTLAANSEYLSSHFLQTAKTITVPSFAITTTTFIGSTSNPFTGTYNGGGNIIEKLTLPLFAVVKHANAKVSNLKLTEVKLSSPTGPTSIALLGAVAGSLESGTITGCDVALSINSGVSNGKVGGLVGHMTGGTISSSVASGTISCSGNGTTYAGGLVGHITSGSINNSVASATITSATHMGCISGFGGTLIGNSCHNSSHSHPKTNNAFMAGNLTLAPEITSVKVHDSQGADQSIISNNATNTAATTTIIIEFNKPMLASSVNATNLKLTPEHHDGLTHSWDETQQILTVTPKTKVDEHAPLNYGTDYSITLQANTAQDIFKYQNLAAAHTHGFKTHPGNLPSVTALEFKILSKHSAQFAFNYYVLGGNPVTEATNLGIEISTDANFSTIEETLNPKSLGRDATLDNLLASTTSLVRNTTYYARAFAENSAGRTYTPHSTLNSVQDKPTNDSVIFKTPKLDRDGEYYTITNVQELEDLKDDHNLKFILGNDLTLVSTWSPPANFSGVLVGNGKTITTSGNYINNGFFDELSGTVSSLTIKLTDNSFTGGIIKTLSGQANDLVVDADVERTITLADEKGIIADKVTATGSLTNGKITANVITTGSGGGCMAGEVAAGGMVSAHGEGNICLAKNHNHAKGDNLVNNLKAAPQLVSALFVSKNGHKDTVDKDRTFGDWAKDIRVAGDIEMTFEFDKAMKLVDSFKVDIIADSDLASGTDYNVFFLNSKTAKVVIPQDKLDYATDYAVTLTNTNKDTFDNTFEGKTWNFRTIGGLPKIFAPKVHDITGSKATIVFAYEMNPDVPAISKFEIGYRIQQNPAVAFTLEEVPSDSYVKNKGASCIHTLKGLASYTVYEIFVKATNTAGDAYDETSVTGPTGSTHTTFTTKAMTGNGTPEAPFQITDRSGILNMGKIVENIEYGLDKWYVLMNDIEGHDLHVAGKFTGNFNGNNKLIGTNSKPLNRTLFEEVGAGGRVYDLDFKMALESSDSKVAVLTLTNGGLFVNIKVDGTLKADKAGAQVAVVAHTNEATGVIRNVKVTGSIEANGGGAQVASIVHSNWGTVDGCVNEATITATGGSEGSEVGGLVYYNPSSNTVKFSQNKGNIVAERAGAIVYKNTGMVASCENTAEVSGTYVAGCALFNEKDIMSSQNKGKLKLTGVPSDTHRSGCMVGVGAGVFEEACGCNDAGHEHVGMDDTKVASQIAGNLYPVPLLQLGAEVAPSAPTGSFDGWARAVRVDAGSPVKVDSSASSGDKAYEIKISGRVPFYQYHPKNGALLNDNLWVAKIKLDRFATNDAKFRINNGTWFAATTGSDNLVPTGNENEYYVVGTGTLGLTLDIDNDGDKTGYWPAETTYERIKVTFVDNGLSLATFAFGEFAATAFAGTETVNGQAVSTSNNVLVPTYDSDTKEVKLAGVVPYFETNGMTGNSATNDWVVKVPLLNVPTTAKAAVYSSLIPNAALTSIATASFDPLVLEGDANGYFYTYGTIDCLNAGALDVEPDTLKILVDLDGDFATTGDQHFVTLQADGETLKPAFRGGSGIVSSPYLVANAAQLHRVTKYETSGIYQQDKDISLSVYCTATEDKGWQPLSTFAGTYNGDNKKVTNLQINRTTDYAGLFKNLAGTGSITNINIEAGKVTAKNYAGLLCSESSGSISHCQATGQVTGEDYTGGLVGHSTGEISYARAEGNVTGASYTGGLVGKSKNTISHSESNGDIEILNKNVVSVGGLVGEATAGITSSHSTGKVHVVRTSSAQARIGGLVGHLSEGTVNDCSSTGEVTVTRGTHVGGLIGGTSTANAKVVNSHASNNVLSDAGYVGGLVGHAMGEISGSHHVGEVRGVGHVGGLVGRTNTGVAVSTSYSDSTVVGSGDYVGGLVGRNRGPVTNCNASGTVTVEANVEYVGGLLGQSFANVTNSHAKGKVTLKRTIYAADTGHVGGLVGQIDAASYKIVDSSATGEVYTENCDRVGGLVGYTPGNITSSHATGKVTGMGNVGGLVGQSDGTLSGCYAMGAVKGVKENVGGLVGQNTKIITSCHASGDVLSSEPSVGGLVGLNTGTVSGTDALKSYATGQVEGARRVGGLVGYNSGGDSVISYAYAGNKVKAVNGSVGGLVGFNNGSISNAYSSAAEVSGTQIVGGLVGYAGATSDISNSHVLNNTIIATSEKVGGLVGENHGKIASSNSKAVEKLVATTVLGGLVGLNDTTGSIENCFSEISIEGTEKVGGLVGQSAGTISRGHAKGKVTATGRDVGGLVGRNDETGKVQGTSGVYVYAEGDVSGADYVGGLIGLNYGLMEYGRRQLGLTSGTHRVGAIVGHSHDGAKVKHCYAQTNVSGSDHVGGVVGRNRGDVEDSYYNTGTVAGTRATGGLVGSCGEVGSVARSHAENCTVTAIEETLGGLIGYSEGAIDTCYAKVNVSLTKTDATGSYVGGLVGRFYPNDEAISIKNSYATGNVTTSNINYTGGLVGHSIGTIEDCYAQGEVAGDDYTGGLVGENTGIIENCHAEGTVTSTKDYVGGLVGRSTGSIIESEHKAADVSGHEYVAGLVGNNHGSIDNCHSLGGTITGYQFVAGLVGQAESTSVIDDSSAAGTITGDRRVAGLVGYNYGSISRSYATTNVTGSTYAVAGLVGRSDGPVEDCYAEGTVVGNGNAYNVGGLVGYNVSSIKNSHFKKGSVEAHYNVGGLVGYNFSTASSIENSDAKVEVVVKGRTTAIGGLVGRSEGNITGCDANASIEITEHDVEYVGGLVGVASGDIASSHALGKVEVKHSTVAVTDPAAVVDIKGRVGGLVGYLLNGTITDCTASGEVTTINVQGVGGLVGDSRGNISGSSATGKVSANVNITYVNDLLVSTGGLVGRNAGEITNSSYTGPEVNGKDQAGGLVGTNLASGEITSSWVTTTVNGYRRFGGFVGFNHGEIDGCESNIILTGDISAGGLVGRNDGKINNSHTKGQINGTGTGHNIGGLVGINLGEIDNCSYDGENSKTVVGGYYIGGLVGRNNTSSAVVRNSKAINTTVTHNTTASSRYAIGGLMGGNDRVVENCESSAKVLVTNPDYKQIGGLVGYNQVAASSITSSSATGEVSAPSNDSVGGLVGENKGIITGTDIKKSYATGKVTGQDYVGGLVGSSSSKISYAEASGEVRGRNRLGGLVGMSIGDIELCSSSSMVEVHSLNASRVGGLVGDLKGDLTNSHATGNVGVVRNNSGTGYVGGLVGELSAAGKTISNCSATGVVATLNSERTGGLVGSAESGSFITSCHSKGNVTSDSKFTGGLVGMSDATVSQCYATGKVVGVNMVGGLIGSSGGYIDHSIATGDVEVGVDGMYIGGLVGYTGVSDKTLTINKCYTNNNVLIARSDNNQDTRAGGLVGHAVHTVHITNCYTLGTVYGLVNNVSYPDINTRTHRAGVYMGGIAGHAASSVRIDRCYSYCKVVGGNNLGGFVGNACTISNGVAYEIVWSAESNSNNAKVGRFTGENSSLTNCFMVGSGMVEPSASYGSSRSGVSGNPGNTNWWDNSTYVGFDITNIWTTANPPTLRGMPTP